MRVESRTPPHLPQGRAANLGRDPEEWASLLGALQPARLRANGTVHLAANPLTTEVMGAAAGGVQSCQDVGEGGGASTPADTRGTPTRPREELAHRRLQDVLPTESALLFMGLFVWVISAPNAPSDTEACNYYGFALYFEILLESQKSPQDGKESSHIPTPSVP